MGSTPVAAHSQGGATERIIKRTGAILPKRRCQDFGFGSACGWHSHFPGQSLVNTWGPVDCLDRELPGQELCGRPTKGLGRVTGHARRDSLSLSSSSRSRPTSQNRFRRPYSSSFTLHKWSVGRLTGCRGSNSSKCTRSSDNSRYMLSSYSSSKYMHSSNNNFQKLVTHKLLNLQLTNCEPSKEL